MLDVVPNFVDGQYRIEGSGELQRCQTVNMLAGSLRQVVQHCLDQSESKKVPVLDVSDTTIHSYWGGEALAHVTFGLSAPWSGKSSLGSEAYEKFWDTLVKANLKPQLVTTSVEVYCWGRTICAIAIDRDAAAAYIHGGGQGGITATKPPVVDRQ